MHAYGAVKAWQLHGENRNMMQFAGGHRCASREFP